MLRRPAQKPTRSLKYQAWAKPEPQQFQVETGPQFREEPGPQFRVPPGHPFRVEPELQFRVEPGPRFRIEPGLQFRALPGLQFRLKPGPLFRLEPKLLFRVQPGPRFPRILQGPGNRKRKNGRSGFGTFTRVPRKIRRKLVESRFDGMTSSKNAKSKNDVTKNVDPENSESYENFVVPYNGRKPNTGQKEGKTIQIISCQGC